MSEKRTWPGAKTGPLSGPPARRCHRELERAARLATVGEPAAGVAHDSVWTHGHE